MKLSFQPVSLEDQTAYQGFFAKCPEVTSDYSFANLWSWAPVYGLEWAWTGTLVWIRQNWPETLLWAPVGDWEQQDWIALKAKFPGVFQEFTRVPETLKDIWQAAFPGLVRSAADRDLWDYLYDARELRELKGNRFHRKKNLVNQFKKKNAYTFVEMDGEMADRAMALQDDWCSWRVCESSSQLASENQAIMKTLRNWGALLNLIGGCIFVEELIVAYTIGEMVTPDTLLIHFEKGCPEYKGAYQAINQLFLEHLSRTGQNRVQWVNREHDLGDEGLRKAKLSYHPIDYLKKYRVYFD